MSHSEVPAELGALLALPPYYNVATESAGQPWNSPVWAARDADFNLYWSSWTEAVHSKNIAGNPRVFLTLYDSTRQRGTNNLRCLYLQASAEEVSDRAEAASAFGLLYPDELSPGQTPDIAGFLGDGQKRFYRATPTHAWLNCLSERELTPSTVKMRTEVTLQQLRAAASAAG